MPRFKVDENLPAELSVLLKSSGHDAVSVLDQHLSGARDDRLAQVCQRERRVLLTLDLDFADIRAYPPAESRGVVVLRLEHQDKAHVIETVRRILPLLEREPTEGRLWIVDERKVRMRGGDE